MFLSSTGISVMTGPPSAPTALHQSWAMLKLRAKQVVMSPLGSLAATLGPFLLIALIGVFDIALKSSLTVHVDGDLDPVC
ncbi:hypothetical protein KIPB_012478 [Kipferlia bialata]|uniref:Uncharacterized protein n=1 Tax=Kipferlia bialata TaxID=797122 RepID=A0A9K3D8Y7_9EUKA|nr:hypothetical protein KIPB_012478 [Kipferlia bialata]|eukprot:g12478.t1